MNRMLPFLLFVPFSLWAGDLPAPATTQADLIGAVTELADSLDRLALLLEKDMALRVEERESARVEVAIGILGLRYRKIERLEGAIHEIDRDEEALEKQMNLMKAEVEQLDRLARTDGRELGEMEKRKIAALELRIGLEEGRIEGLGERKSVLQNDITAEQRRLADVEAILDAWMEKQ